MSREVKVGNEWVRVAGRGKAEYGASHYQTGTVVITAKDVAYGTYGVTFSEPMPDPDYIVVLEINGLSGDNWHNKTFNVSYDNKTVNGFMICVGKPNDTAIEAGVTVKWQAFKLYSDKEYDGLLDDVATLKTSVATNKNDIATLKSEVTVKSAFTSGNGTTVSTTLNNLLGTSWNPIYVFYDKNIYLISIGKNTDTLTIHDVANNTGVVLSSATLTKVSGNTYTLSLTFGTAIYGRCFIHYR